MSQQRGSKATPDGPLLRAFPVLIFFGLALAGCAAGPRPPAEYAEVDFTKFTSGAFVDEFSGRLVKMKLGFVRQSADLLPGGYSSGRNLAFMAASPEPASTPAIFPRPLIVVVPKDMADAIFNLKTGDRIIVYGKATPVRQYGVTGAIMKRGVRNLVIEAHRLERE